MMRPIATMRQLALFAVVMLAACEQPVAPSYRSMRPGIPLIASADKSAGTTTSVNQKIEVSGTMNSPCTGEPIAYQGTIHIVSTTTQTSDGVTMKYHLNTDALSAVGLVTGTKYNMIQMMKEDAELQMHGDELWDVAMQYRIVSQGSADNFAADIVYSATNPASNVTYRVQNLRCQG